MDLRHSLMNWHKSGQEWWSNLKVSHPMREARWWQIFGRPWIFSDSFYVHKHVEGAAMGSPLSTVVYNQPLHRGIWEKGTGDLSSGTSFLGKVCRQCLHHLATWQPVPGWVPGTPEHSVFSHAIHHREGEWQKDCLPWYTDRGYICNHLNIM